MWAWKVAVARTCAEPARQRGLSAATECEFVIEQDPLRPSQNGPQFIAFHLLFIYRKTLVKESI